MTRQYIGARYVPKFFADENGNPSWRDSIPYEALTIVMYLGNSYTSKKAVPIGIQIDNTEYWVLTGAYNEQVEQYREEVENLRNMITKKNVLCIGDSYLAYSSQEMETESWGAFLRIYLGSSNNVTLNGMGGSGFVGNTTRTFGVLLSEKYNSMTDEERNAITDIVVCGGLNDASAVADGKTSFDDVISAMRLFFTNASTYFPNARVHVGAIGWMATGYTNRDSYMTTFRSIIELYRKSPFYSTSGKVDYLTGVEYIMPIEPINNYKPDLIHPTAQASSAIGMAIYNALMRGTSQGGFRTYDRVILIPSGHGTEIFDNSLKVTADGNQINLIGGSFGIHLDIKDIATLNDIEIATCTQPIRATTSNPLVVHVIVAIFPGKDGVYDVVNGELKFSNGKVNLKFLYSSSVGHYTGVTNISVFVPTITADVITAC